jgi:hypothetical protein
LANVFLTAMQAIYQRYKLQGAKMSFGKFGTKMNSFLRALQLFDRDNKLSLTSIGVMVILTKIALAPVLDWATASTLLLALLSYNAKKVLAAKEKQQETAANSKIEEVEQKILELTKSFNLKNLLK